MANSTKRTIKLDINECIEQSAAPSNPASGKKKLYFKNDGKLYKLDSSGTETEVGGTGGGSLTTSTVTSDTTMAAGTEYITNSASLLAMKLPASSSVGDRIRIVGRGTGKWKIVSNASASSQKINRDASSSNISASSVIDLVNASNRYGACDIVCTVANSEWTVYNDINISLVADANWWGTAADGSVTISANTNLTTTLDGDMIVKNYEDLTINSGVTLSLSNRCRGALIYVHGNCNIQGNINLDALGGKANPADSTVTSDTPVAPSDAHAVPSTGIQIRRVKTGQTSSNSNTDLFYGCGNDAVNSEANQAVLSSNGQVFTIARTGGSAGSGQVAAGSQLNGGAGGTGTGMSGGGGGGGARNLSGGSATSGNGGAGTCFSGGAGAGGCLTVGATNSSSNGSSYGGAGTAAVQSGSVGTGQTGGGAGNDGGAGANGGNAGTNGTGGTLILLVRGNLTIGASATISARGKNGGGGSIAGGGGGGASGGGNIVILYGGTLSNSGTITAAGGTGGVISGSSSSGGDGGAGSIQGPTVINV